MSERRTSSVASFIVSRSQLHCGSLTMKLATLHIPMLFLATAAEAVAPPAPSEPAEANSIVLGDPSSVQRQMLQTDTANQSYQIIDQRHEWVSHTGHCGITKSGQGDCTQGATGSWVASRGTTSPLQSSARNYASTGAPDATMCRSPRGSTGLEISTSEGMTAHGTTHARFRCSRASRGPDMSRYRSGRCRRRRQSRAASRPRAAHLATCCKAEAKAKAKANKRKAS